MKTTRAREIAASLQYEQTSTIDKESLKIESYRSLSRLFRKARIEMLLHVLRRLPGL